MVAYDFSGTVAFVTGAARGQGRAHAINYAKQGANVVAVDLGSGGADANTDVADAAELHETVERVESQGSRGLAVEADVSEEEQVEEAVDRALAEFGRIDFLANNAGVAPVGGLLDLDEETWDRTLDVDLKGMWLCAKHVGGHMVERGEGGRIVNTSSVAGLRASPGLGHYTAAKHGVIGLTKALAAELAPHGITVNAVCPTAVDTPMTAGIVESIDEDLAELAEQSGADNLLGEIVQPEDVSGAFLWLCSEDARFVTGATIPVDAGATIL